MIEIVYFSSVSEPKPVCTYKKLKYCVAPNRQMLLELRNNDEKQTSVNCECMQNCVDSDVFINSYKALVDTNELLGTIGGIAVVKEYPLVRYKRRILFSITDFFGKINLRFFLEKCSENDFFHFFLYSLDRGHSIIFHWILCAWRH